MPQSPEPQRRPDPAGGEEDKNQTHDNPEEDPGTRPPFLESINAHRQEKEEAVQGNQDRPAHLVLPIDRRIEKAQSSGESKEEIAGGRRAQQHHEEPEQWAVHRGCRSTSSK